MRYLTWNMQGGNEGKFGNVASFMKKEKIGIACLQETGTLPKQYLREQKIVNGVALNIGVFTSGTARSGANYTVVNYDNRQGSNNRCSLAIFCESAVLDFDVINAPSVTLRPIIGIKLAQDRWIYCIHAPSSGAAAGVAGSMLSSIPNARSSWACFGDYNCEPAKIRCPPSARTIGGTSRTHQSGGKLDYAVMKNMQLSLCTTSSSLASDHYSQTFEG